MRKRELLALLLTLSLTLPLSSAEAGEPSKSEIAEALAFSGCSWGLSNANLKADLKTSMELTIYAGLILALIDNGTTNKVILKIENPTIRSGSEHVTQSWVTAGALDSRWKPLTQSYQKAIEVGIKKWNSGSNLGIAQKAAFSSSSSSLTSLCRIARIGVYDKSGTSYSRAKQYVIKTAGQYLPPLPK